MPCDCGGLAAVSRLYRLVEERYEEVKGHWEERFEPSYGRWRGLVDRVVYAFVDCGDLEHGFARVFCDACRAEYLLAFSCSRRGFCPSCAAKRGALFGALVREEVAEDVGHCLWTFTVPKLLRPAGRALRPRRAARPAADAHPAPRLHLVRHYGHYSHVARARRRQAENEAGSGALSSGGVPADDDVSRAERRRLRRQWAALIRRIYEADPLVCTCGAPMRVLSFITEPPVVRKILEHLERSGRDPARAPPALDPGPAALAS